MTMFTKYRMIGRALGVAACPDSVVLFSIQAESNFFLFPQPTVVKLLEQVLLIFFQGWIQKVLIEWMLKYNI